MRTKDKIDQLIFTALRNKLQKIIRRKEKYYQQLINADGQKNSDFFDCISRLKGKFATQDRNNKETADKFIDYFSSVAKHFLNQTLSLEKRIYQKAVV